MFKKGCNEEISRLNKSHNLPSSHCLSVPKPFPQPTSFVHYEKEDLFCAELEEL